MKARKTECQVLVLYTLATSVSIPEALHNWCLRHCHLSPPPTTTPHSFGPHPGRVNWHDGHPVRLPAVRSSHHLVSRDGSALRYLDGALD